MVNTTSWLKSPQYVPGAPTTRTQVAVQKESITSWVVGSSDNKHRLGSRWQRMDGEKLRRQLALFTLKGLVHPKKEKHNDFLSFLMHKNWCKRTIKSCKSSLYNYIYLNGFQFQHKKCVPWMQCKLLWMKVSAKCRC